MIRLLQIFLTVVLTSLFFFPFELTVLPGINSKMIMAVVGLAFCVAELVKRQSFTIPKELLSLLFFASAGSLFSLLSITLNQTPDTTYVSFIISFCVWLSAAFVVCCCIRWTHGRMDVQLVLDYLIAVCLIQCILALVINNKPLMAQWINTHTYFGQDVAIKTKRLYGIGALLDVAGLRMAAVLSGIAFYLSEVKVPLSPVRRIFYILSFFVISVIGNMIARTTLVGTGLGAAVILLGLFLKPSLPGSGEKLPALFSWVLILGIGIAICVPLYNTNPQAHKLLRFAFEGFFSLAEEGHWEVSSNEKLKTMVVFPETMHTWIIGDGYFMNARYDENYLGDSTDMGFYMGTDIGYLRFIFYFGILGLIPMIGVIVYSAFVCMRHFPRERLFFLLAMMVGLIVWFKVSTDIFLYLALFLSAAALKDKETQTT